VNFDFPRLSGLARRKRLRSSGGEVAEVVETERATEGGAELLLELEVC